MKLDPLDTARAALAPYGYTIAEDGEIITPRELGSHTRATIKGPRLQVRSLSGPLLWSGSPDQLGEFAEEYWFARAMRPPTLAQLEEAVLWAERDDDDTPLDQVEHDGFAPSASAYLADVLARFWEGARSLLTYQEAMKPDTVALMLWLTAMGSGVGFWDGRHERGDELTALVESLGIPTDGAYVGDDGLVYICGAEDYTGGEDA